MNIKAINTINYKGVSKQKENQIRNKLKQDIEHSKEVKKEYEKLQAELGYYKPLLVTVKEKCSAMQKHYMYYIIETRRQDPMMSKESEEAIDIFKDSIARFEILKDLDEIMYSRKINPKILNQLGIENELIEDTDLMQYNIKLLNQADIRIVEKLQNDDLIYLFCSNQLEKGLEEFSRLTDEEIEKLSHSKFMDLVTCSTIFTDEEAKAKKEFYNQYYIQTGQYLS